MVRRKATPADQDQPFVQDAPAVDILPALQLDDAPASEIAAEIADVPPPKRGKTGATLALGAVLALGAAALGYGAALKFPIIPQTPAQQVDLSAIEAKIAALDLGGKTDGLEARMTALESATAPDISALESRIAALETRLKAVLPADDIRAELADIRAKLGQTDPAPAIKAAIAAEMGAVQAQAQQMAATVQAAAQEAAAQSALGMLHAALDTGAPFVSAAKVLTLPQALAKYADVGIPSVTALKDSFPDAARAGLDAALRANMGATWADRAVNFLRSQTGARSLTPQTGSDPDAVLSRIEAGLRGADMQAVMGEISALPADAQTAMAVWIETAQIRTDALTAFASLTEKAQ